MDLEEAKTCPPPPSSSSLPLPPTSSHTSSNAIPTHPNPYSLLSEPPPSVSERATPPNPLSSLPTPSTLPSSMGNSISLSGSSSLVVADSPNSLSGGGLSSSPSYYHSSLAAAGGAPSVPPSHPPSYPQSTTSDLSSILAVIQRQQEQINQLTASLASFIRQTQKERDVSSQKNGKGQEEKGNSSPSSSSSSPPSSSSSSSSRPPAGLVPLSNRQIPSSPIESEEESDGEEKRSKAAKRRERSKKQKQAGQQSSSSTSSSSSSSSSTSQPTIPSASSAPSLSFSSSYESEREESEAEKEKTEERKNRNKKEGKEKELRSSSASSSSSPSSSVSLSLISSSSASSEAEGEYMEVFGKKKKAGKKKEKKKKEKQGQSSSSSSSSSASSSSSSPSSSSTQNDQGNSSSSASRKEKKTDPLPSLLTKKVRISLHKGEHFDPCAVEIFISSSSPPEPLSPEGRAFKQSIVRLLSRSGHSPAQQAAMFQRLIIARELGNVKQSMREKIQKQNQPLYAAAFVVESAPTKRRQKPADPSQQTLDSFLVERNEESEEMKIENSLSSSSSSSSSSSASAAAPFNRAPSSSPSISLFPITGSPPSQRAALAGDISIRTVFSSREEAENVADFFNEVGKEVKRKGVLLSSRLDSLPIHLVEIQFDLPLLGEELKKRGDRTLYQVMDDALHTCGITTNGLKYTILNKENECQVNPVAENCKWGGIMHIRYRPRLLLPLSALPQLRNLSSSTQIQIRTEPKKMCRGCGPRSISSRAWCKNCTERRLTAVRQGTPYEVYCFKCEKTVPSSHISTCTERRSFDSLCQLCQKKHRSSLCPGNFRPIQDTVIGQQILNLSPSDSSSNAKAGGASEAQGKKTERKEEEKRGDGNQRGWENNRAPSPSSFSSSSSSPSSSSSQPVAPVSSSVEKRFSAMEKRLDQLSRAMELVLARLPPLPLSNEGEQPKDGSHSSSSPSSSSPESAAGKRRREEEEEEEVEEGEVDEDEMDEEKERRQGGKFSKHNSFISSIPCPSEFSNRKAANTQREH